MTDDDEDYAEYDYDMDEEEYSGALEQEADTEETTPEREYAVLTPQDLLEEQASEVARITAVCGFSNPSWARILLRRHQWDVEALLNNVFDRSGEAVLREAGIDPTEAEAKLVDGKMVCEACTEEVEPGEAYAPSCGHGFCNDCWTTFITMKVTEGQAKRITCMGFKCKLMLDDAVIVNFVEPSIRARFTRALVESFVDDNDNVRWCPSVPHCGNCVRVTAVGKCVDVACSCGHGFCFKCCEETHSPATCAMMKKWNEKCKDDSETCNWLKSNTKDCPNCQNAIEKNGGCNFIMCTKCNREFCWFCLHLTPQGGSLHPQHPCNKFPESDSGNATEARESLNRYLHYFERWKGHHDSHQFEADLRKKVGAKVETLSEEATGAVTVYEIQWMMEGIEKLFQCRHILKQSYVFAFYMFSSGTGPASGVIPVQLSAPALLRMKNLFEDHQQQLENTTERLSAALERPAEEFVTSRETPKVVQNMTTLAETRLRGLYDVVHRDMLEGDSGIVAPYHFAQPSPYHPNVKGQGRPTGAGTGAAGGDAAPPPAPTPAPPKVQAAEAAYKDPVLEAQALAAQEQRPPVKETPSRWWSLSWGKR